MSRRRKEEGGEKVGGGGGGGRIGVRETDRRSLGLRKRVMKRGRAGLIAGNEVSRHPVSLT